MAAALVLTFAASSALPSTAAADPNCGGEVIAKDAPPPVTAPVTNQEPQQAPQPKQSKQRAKSKAKKSSKKKRRPKKRARTASAPTAPAADTSAGTTYWQCTFSDEFDGTTLDSSKWVPQRTDYSGYTSGPTACFVDSPNNISVSDGTLKLTARKEADPFTCAPGTPASFKTQYTSGMVSTYGRFSQTYGRFEVRARISSASVPGLHTAFWLWPDDTSKYGGWPGSGEIDFAELYSQYSDRAIPYIHYNPATPDPNVSAYDCYIGNPAAFHTYAVEWTSSQIKVIYDGQTCLIDHWNPADPLTKPAPFDQPFMVALTQALGVSSNQFDPDSTPLPATTTVDYVRVWA